MLIRLLLVVILSCTCLSSCKEKVENAATQATPVKENAAKYKGAEEGSSIAWIYTLNEGLQTAGNENKPMMVDFTAGWCGWCKKLDKDVFANPEVIEISKGFVNVKVNTDKYPADARKYSVRGLPTILFLDSEGKVIEQIIGYRGSDYFVSVMSKILKDG